MATATMEDVRLWKGKTVVGPRGDSVGTIEDVYFDSDTGRPEWALVNTGMFGLKHNFIPITETTPTGNSIQVRWDADFIKHAPKVASDEELSQQQEQELANYYGMQYSQEQSSSGLPVDVSQQERRQQERRQQDQQQSGQYGGDAMTRSQEEVRPGTRRRPSELVRLRKHVVTENVQQTVPVTREEVRIEREPITDENREQVTGGTDRRDDVQEEILYTEEPVIEDR